MGALTAPLRRACCRKNGKKDFRAENTGTHVHTHKTHTSTNTNTHHESQEGVNFLVSPIEPSVKAHLPAVVVNERTDVEFPAEINVGGGCSTDIEIRAAVDDVTVGVNGKNVAVRGIV